MEIEARETAYGVEIAVRVPSRAGIDRAGADRADPARAARATHALRLPAGVRIASASGNAVTVLVAAGQRQPEAGGDWPALDAHAPAPVAVAP